VPPSLAAPTSNGGPTQFTVNGFTGQTVFVQASSDLRNWGSIGTNTLAGTTWNVVDREASNYAQRFYRAVLAP